jgi:DNA-binding transcriptional MerR regulator
MPKSRTSRSQRRDRASLETPFIPEKLYFRIGEVSRLTHTKSYVLRYWETEFPMLRPGKSSTGHRLYRRRDVETVLQIRSLLYGQGFTIEGARKKLAGEGGYRRQTGKQKQLFQGERQLGATAGLSSIRHELRGILEILKRK